MNFRRPPADPASRITWQVALGISEPDLPNWPRVREAQRAEAARHLPLVYALTLAGVLLTVAVLWLPRGNATLVGWAACDAVAMLGLIWLTRTPPRARRLIGRRVNLHSLVRGGLLGLLWTMPPALFAGHGTEVQRLAMCLISAAMMAFTAITALTLPIGMISALLLASAGVTVMLAQAGGGMPMVLLPQGYAITLAVGGVLGTRGFLRRHWSEREAVESREVVSLLLREFEDEDADWLWQTDAAKMLVEVSPRLAEAAGRPIAELERQSLPRMIAGDQWADGAVAPEVARLVQLLNARESFSDLQLPVAVAGETRWWSLSAAPRFAGNGDYLGFRGKGTDITEQRRSVDRIDHLAKFDTLTGLANRGHFMDLLRKALPRAHRADPDGGCALLLVDLDRFKPVNDTLGHPVGDRLLKLVADRLRNLLGEGDAAGRLGGDEFALLLRRAAPERVDRMGAAIIARLNEPFEIDGSLIRIGASVGSATGPRDGRLSDALVRHADLALYRAKDDGRGCHRRYDPSLLAATNRRRAIEEGLRRALDTGGLHLVYQPIADARGGRIRAFEALVRWVDPELGEVGPGLFGPIAEEARLAGRMAEWTLRTACAAAASWPDGVGVHVDLTAGQLGDRQLPATILSALSHAGLPAERLVIELAEGIFMRGGESVAALTQGLRGIGAGIAIDAFGTRHAPLACIAEGGVATVKIVADVVREAGTGRPEAIALIGGVVAMTGALGITAIANGIATAAEHDAAIALGCRFVQGPAIGAAVDAAGARALLGEAVRLAG